MATQETFELTDASRPALYEVGDKELTLSFQAGDRRAYDSIYERYSGRVLGVCHRMLGDARDAEDAAQETFLRVYQALPRFNGRYQLGAWITRIATNVCLDVLRSRSRARAEAAPDEVLEFAVAGDRVDDDPEQVVLRHAEGDRVQATMSSLSALQRRALFLRDYEGRDYKEIAETLGVSETRARVLLHRARKGFRRSWTTGWVVLGLPARLLQRVRRLRGPAATDQVAQAASSVAHTGQTVAASPPVFSCSHVIQSCSDLVTERIAAVATAALVGVSAAGGAAPVVLDPGSAARSLAEVVPSSIDGFLIGELASGDLVGVLGGTAVAAGEVTPEASFAEVTSVPPPAYPVPASQPVPATDDGSELPDDSEAEASEPTDTTGEGEAPEAEQPTEDPSPEPTPEESPPPEEDPSVPAGGSSGGEPTPEPTPEPDPTPDPEPTPEPTPEPDPTAEPDPTPEPEPTPDPGA